jgi:predicted permease
MNLRDLSLRIRALSRPRRVEDELDEELAFHIERETQNHVDAGMSPAEARRLARSRFGSVPLAADQCRDARGIAPVDALVRDVVYAFRMCRRAPLAALTIISTVAVGLGLVAVVFTFYNLLFLRVDAVRNPGELFAVEQSTGPADNDDALPFTGPDYDAMRRETSVFTDIIAVLRPVRARVDGRVVTASLVTGNFFQVLGVQAAHGRPLIPGSDQRYAARPPIVLSHLGWQRLFAGEPMVIGRSVVLNGAPYEIVGVTPDGFRGLGVLPPDLWAPLELAGQFRSDYAGKEDRIAIEIVGRLKPGLSAAAATAGLTPWASTRTDPRAVRGQPPSIRLQPSTGVLAAETVGSLMSFAPIFLVFGLILMIGCANVANLLLARGVSRQREIAVRLSLGASRRRIISQLLTESFLLALIAAAGGLALSRLFLQGMLGAVINTVPPELLEVDLTRFVPPVADWRVLVFLVAAAIVSTAFFGLAPALQSTRFALVQAMRGEVMGARPGRARHALIALQVGASALLLISAAIFLRGSLGVTTDGLALRTNDNVRVSIANESRRSAIVQALRDHPLVATVAASSRPEGDFVATSLSADAKRAPVSQLAVSHDYFDVLGIEVVSGRSFTQAERTADAGVVVLSERIARQLWPGGDAVGQAVRIDAQEPHSPNGVSARTVTVVGVVRDPAREGGMSYLDTFRGVYVPAGPETPGTWLMLRVRGNPEQVRQALLGPLMSIDPGLNGILTLQTLAGMQTYALQAAFAVTVVLGGLALLLTVSGLFSVLSYVVEQQAKEIGVRMALGAGTTNVVGLVLSQSLRPVSSGLAGGGGLAVAAAIVLTATATELRGWMHLLDPVAYLSSVLVIVTSCVLAVSVPALRAARIDPIATLRKD